MPKSKVAEEIFALLFKIMVHNNGAIYFIQCAGCNHRRLPVGYYTEDPEGGDNIPEGYRCEQCLHSLQSFAYLNGTIEVYEWRSSVNRLEELGILVPNLVPASFPRYKQGSKIIWMEESLDKARKRRSSARKEIVKVGDHICVQLPGNKDYTYCRVVGLTKTHISLNVCGVAKDYLRSEVSIAIPENQRADFNLDKDQ